jgi:hypothetical protein
MGFLAHAPLDAVELLRITGDRPGAPWRYQCAHCGITVWALGRVGGTITHAVDGVLCGPIEPDDTGPQGRIP